MQIIQSIGFSNKEIASNPNYNPELPEEKGNPYYNLNPHKIVISNKKASVSFYSNYQLDKIAGDKYYIEQILSLNNDKSDFENALSIILK